MKRSVLALFLAAVLVVSLTACGGRQESDNSAKSADAAVSEKQESGTQNNSTASVNAAGEQSTGESVSSAGSGAALSNDAAGGSASNAGTVSGTSNKPGSNANTGANSSGASGSSGSSNHSSGSNSSGAKPTEPPAKHTHHFVDVGVQALEWSAAQQDNTGPTNTREQVGAANVCLSCGYFYGNDDDKFAERYMDHILGPNSSQNCTGAYTLAPIYACYHLLECSCGTLKRGKFDHYEYLLYFDGTSNPATKFVLKNWQSKELGLSHT